MIAAAHFFLLIACIGITIGAIAATKRRELKTLRAGIFAVLIPFLLALLPATMRHMCAEGNPFSQWLVPLLCLWAVFVCIDPARVRRGLGAVLTIVMFGLSWHYIDFVHTREWTGNPDWDRMQRRMATQTLELARERVREIGAVDETTYPAGWLSETTIGSEALMHIYKGSPRYSYGGATTVWHSFLTGLYRRREMAHELWYPGGRAVEAADGIELRERPLRDDAIAH